MTHSVADHNVVTGRQSGGERNTVDVFIDAFNHWESFRVFQGSQLGGEERHRCAVESTDAHGPIDASDKLIHRCFSAGDRLGNSDCSYRQGLTGISEFNGSPPRF